MKVAAPTESHESPPAESIPRLFGALAWIALLLIGLSFIGWWIESKEHSILYIGLEIILLWSTLVAVNINLYFRWSTSTYAAIWQWVLLCLGLAFIWKIAYPALQFSYAMHQLPSGDLRLAAVSLLVSAAILYFFTNYVRTVQKNLALTSVTFLLQLSQISYLACAASSAITFLFLSTERDYTPIPGWFLICLTFLLILEPFLRFAGRFYLPKSQRSVPAPFGTSLILDSLFGSKRNFHALKSEFENLIGSKVEDIWLLRFLREALEAVIFAGLILGWLSTCFTAVPLGSHGVQISFGKYEQPALDPGLHLSWPWPLGEIDLVQTDYIREISLGFDQDLSGPVLWTERHYTGEQNLLVGDGESLLTIDVPIQYRVSDALAFLKATPDVPMALKSLAEKKLNQVTRSRESFQIMTVDRTQLADELKQGLQDEINRLGLGLEVVFVGLKDVHPPVDVAPAYERVVGAQEDKEAIIDGARAYQASILPEANAEAQRLTVEAEATKTKRIDLATGEAAHFSALASAQQDSPSVFRTRLRYDVLDETLPAPAKIIVGTSGQNSPSTYLDLRSTKSSADSIPLQQPPTPGRSTPQEAYER